MGFAPFERTIMPDDNTKVLISYDEFEKMETLVIQPSFHGTAKEFGLVLPLPGKPTITETNEDIFKDLELITTPQLAMPQSDESLSMAAEGVSGNLGVTIIDTKDVGDYSTVTLTAENNSSMTNWLDENEFVYTERDEENFDYYIQKGGYFFVVFKVNMNEAKIDVNGNIDGKLRPIEFTFPSKYPMLPFRSMTSDMEEMRFTLYTLSDLPYFVPGVDTVFVEEFSNNRYSYTDFPPSLIQYDPLDKWLLRMSIDFDPKKIEQNLVLVKTKEMNTQWRGIINQEDISYDSGILDGTSFATTRVLDFAEQVSPKQQLDMGIHPDDIECKKEYVLMKNTNTQNIACITSETSIKLLERGWDISQMHYDEIERLF